MSRNTGWMVLAAVLLVSALLVGHAAPTIARAAERDNASAIPPTGSRCVVYLRGDAAGVAFHDRIADLGSLIDRKGTVVAVDDTWLVIQNGDRRDYIPRTSIMLIETEK